MSFILIDKANFDLLCSHWSYWVKFDIQLLSELLDVRLKLVKFRILI